MKTAIATLLTLGTVVLFSTCYEGISSPCERKQDTEYWYLIVGTDTTIVFHCNGPIKQP